MKRLDTLHKDCIISTKAEEIVRVFGTPTNVARQKDSNTYSLLAYLLEGKSSLSFICNEGGKVTRYFVMGAVEIIGK